MTSRDEYLLLPASRAYIAFTILLAVVLNIMPWGRDYGIPDFLALVLVFWNVHQPRKVGIGIGFLLGLLMDVHSSSALGERAMELWPDAEPIAPSGLVAFLAGQLAGYEVPAEVRIVDELPRTDSGKVDLSAVTALLQAPAPGS